MPARLATRPDELPDSLEWRRERLRQRGPGCRSGRNASASSRSPARFRFRLQRKSYGSVELTRLPDGCDVPARAVGDPARFWAWRSKIRSCGPRGADRLPGAPCCWAHIEIVCNTTLLQRLYRRPYPQHGVGVRGNELQDQQLGLSSEPRQASGSASVRTRARWRARDARGWGRGACSMSRGPARRTRAGQEQHRRSVTPATVPRSVPRHRIDGESPVVIEACRVPPRGFEPRFPP